MKLNDLINVLCPPVEIAAYSVEKLSATREKTAEKLYTGTIARQILE